jgi:hypothetical protein
LLTDVEQTIAESNEIKSSLEQQSISLNSDDDDQTND